MTTSLSASMQWEQIPDLPARGTTTTSTLLPSSRGTEKAARRSGQEDQLTPKQCQHYPDLFFTPTLQQPH